MLGLKRVRFATGASAAATVALDGVEASRPSRGARRRSRRRRAALRAQGAPCSVEPDTAPFSRVDFGALFDVALLALEQIQGSRGQVEALQAAFRTLAPPALDAVLPGPPPEVLRDAPPLPRDRQHRRYR